MGSQVCCCRSRLEATDEDGEGVAPADFAKQASATKAAADKAAASKRAASDKAQAAIGTVHFVTDAFLLAGGAVPVFGDFFELIAHFKEQCVDLLGRVDEANEVETWAQDEVNMLEEIEKQIYQCADTGSNGWAANGLRRAAIKLNECIKQRPLSWDEKQSHRPRHHHQQRDQEHHPCCQSGHYRPSHPHQ